MDKIKSNIKNFKILKNIDEANCITHSGKFHTDEVLATVILINAIEKVDLVRVNEVSENINNKIIYDIGGGKFDHHQVNKCKYRENGVKYASCGLIWQEYRKKHFKKV